MDLGTPGEAITCRCSGPSGGPASGAGSAADRHSVIRPCRPARSAIADVQPATNPKNSRSPGDGSNGQIHHIHRASDPSAVCQRTGRTDRRANSAAGRRLGLLCGFAAASESPSKCGSEPNQREQHARWLRHWGRPLKLVGDSACDSGAIVAPAPTAKSPSTIPNGVAPKSVLAAGRGFNVVKSRCDAASNTLTAPPSLEVL